MKTFKMETGPVFFNKGDPVPWWIYRMEPPDITGTIVFGCSVQAQIIDGITNVWPVHPRADDVRIVCVDGFDKPESHPYKRDLIIIGYPTTMHFLPRELEGLGAIQEHTPNNEMKTIEVSEEFVEAAKKLFIVVRDIHESEHWKLISLGTKLEALFEAKEKAKEAFNEVL